MADVMQMPMTMQIPCPIDYRIEPDTLGDINVIVRMLRRHDGTIIKSALCQRPRSNPKITYGIAYPLYGLGLSMTLAAWNIEIDGRRVLTALEHETWPEPPPVPRPPWRQRAATKIRATARTAADATANQLGYSRTGECACCDDRMDY